MIRKLVEEDRKMTMDFLGKEPAINIFIIGDIEAFGFDEDFQELWGQFDDQNELEGVLLRFIESYIPYFAKENFDVTGFKKIIDNAAGKIILSGKAKIVREFLNMEEMYSAKNDYFCELTEDKLLEKGDKYQIKVAKEKDAEKISELLAQIVEFEGLSNSSDRIADKIKTKTGRVYYVENEMGKMISLSQTSAENSKSAMITGVATLPEYRGKGIMSACLSKLCGDLLKEGKTLCLFYDNPKAGSVYHRLGFKSIDNWIMISRGN